MRSYLPAAVRCLVLLALGIVGCSDAAESDGGDNGSTSPGGAAPIVSAQAVNSYAHDPGAFTQGLVFHGGSLYESTGGHGTSSLRKVDLASGNVLQRVAVPEAYFAEGIALLGERLYQLTWQQGTAFVYDPATLKPMQSFSYRGEGWGLTTDGQSLILSDGTSVLQFLDPTTFQVTRRFTVMDGSNPVHLLNELEWVRGEIWANVWHRDQIARIHPETGRVVGWIDLAHLAPAIRAQNPEAVLNGIAFDEQTGRVFVTGKLWPVLYEIHVPAA